MTQIQYLSSRVRQRCFFLESMKCNMPSWTENFVKWAILSSSPSCGGSLSCSSLNDIRCSVILWQERREIVMGWLIQLLLSGQGYVREHLIPEIPDRTTSCIENRRVICIHSYIQITAHSPDHCKSRWHRRRLDRLVIRMLASVSTTNAWSNDG